MNEFERILITLNPLNNTRNLSLNKPFTIFNLQPFPLLIINNSAQENAHPDVILMLLGNKNDCADREVPLHEGETLSKVQ